MTPTTFRNITIRNYEDADYDEVISLDLKSGDKEELYRMCNLEPKEYLIWHISYHGQSTKVVLLYDKIIGILGISEGTLYFTTTNISKGASINFVRAFKWAIQSILKDEGKKSIVTYVDTLYNSTIKWAELCGFIITSEVEINNNRFYCMKYKLT